MEKLKLKIKQHRLEHNCRTEREKYYPGPGLEPGNLAFRANFRT